MFSIVPIALLAAKPPLPVTLQEVLSTQKLDGASVSAYVAKLDGTVLYEHNSDLKVIPASNEKLLTATYALFRLGADYRPETRIWKLPDKLIIETTGDPMLSYQQLMDAHDRLGLKGDLPVYVKEPYRPGIPPGWKTSYLYNKYAAPVTAFTVDRGSFELWGGKDHLFFMPRAYRATIDYSKSRHFHLSFDPFKQVATVSGPIPDQPVLLDTLALKDPDEDAAMILGKSFDRTEITPTTPPDFVIQGDMLADVVKECLVHSDNNIAEHLLLMAAQKEGPLGDTPYGLAPQRMRDFLSKCVGFEASDIDPHDGSGLGRGNQVTTRALAKLLLWNASQPTNEMWKSSLASPGNGTLKKRLEGTDFCGKTGTLDGVVALSGYATTADKTPLVVSVILNNHRCGNTAARGIVDDFVRKIEATDLSGTVIDGSVPRESHSSHPMSGAVPRHRLY